MARKKKVQIELHPGKPRGTEHLADDQVIESLPGARLDQAGNEILSTEPIVLHLKRRTVTDLETLRNTIRAIRAHDGPIEFETFQEADDFDIEDDYGDFSSRWEIPADGDHSDPNMPTAEEYVRYRTTGEIPQRFLQDPSRVNSAPPGGASSAPVQGAAPPAPTEGKPSPTPAASAPGAQ